MPNLPILPRTETFLYLHSLKEQAHSRLKSKNPLVPPAFSIDTWSDIQPKVHAPTAQAIIPFILCGETLLISRGNVPLTWSSASFSFIAWVGRLNKF